MRMLAMRACAVVLAGAALVALAVWVVTGGNRAAGDAGGPGAPGAHREYALPWPGDLPDAPPDARSAEVRRQLDPVRQAWEAQDWAAVAKQSEAVLAGSPARPVEAMAAYALGLARMKQRDAQGAAGAFRRCVRASQGAGGGPGGLLGQARHLLLFCEVAGKVKAEEEAAAEARELLEQMPDAEGGSMSLQLVTQSLGRAGGANAQTQYVEGLVARYPRKAVGRDALLQVAQQRWFAGDRDGALQCFDRLKEWCDQRPDWASFAETIPKLVADMERATRAREEAVKQHEERSEREKAAAEAAKAIPRATPGAPTEGYEDRMVALRQVARDHPGTGVARRTRLLIAASELLYARAVLGGAGPEAEKLRRDALALCEEGASGAPEEAAGRRGMSMPAAARLLKAAVYKAEGDPAAASAEWQATVAAAEPWELAWGMESLALVYRDAGDAEGEVDCLERILARYESSQEEHVARVWRSAVMHLPDAYRRLSPPADELAAAHCRRLLARSPAGLVVTQRGRDGTESTTDLSIPLRQQLSFSAERAAKPAPGTRAVAYMRLWQKGYHEEMHRYLAASAARGTNADSFAAWLKELAGKGVRPAQFEVLKQSISQDEREATVQLSLQLERDLPPEFVSGEVRFEFVSQHMPIPEMPPVGRDVWVMEKGVAMP